MAPVGFAGSQSTSSFARILEVLTRHRVEFVVVGGVAAVLHGAPVTTFDLDTLIRGTSPRSACCFSTAKSMRTRRR